MPINEIWKTHMRLQRLRIRAPRNYFKGIVRSLYVKQYRGNVWGSVRFKPGFMRKVGHYDRYLDDARRHFGNSGMSNDSHFDFHQIVSPVRTLSVFRNLFSRWKHHEYPLDFTWYKQFYRTYNKTNYFRHQRNLLYHRTNSFEGNFRRHVFRRQFREGTIKGNAFSGNLFVYRFVSRLSHFLYFTGFSHTLALATRLVISGFVLVDDVVITDPNFKIPLYSRVQLSLSKFMYNLISPSIISYHNFSTIPSLEVNFKLPYCTVFSSFVILIEVIFQGGLTDFMFLYEIFAPVIKNTRSRSRFI
jgi:ribosomal protein S4